MSKAKLLAVLACASSLFAGNALAATPLTRYFPDFPLAVIEAKDLQESIQQTGSFGEDTLKFLGVLFDEAIRSEAGADLELPPALQNAAVKTLVASIRDIAAAGYSVGNNIEYLVAVRFTPKNFVITALSKTFNDTLKDSPAAQKLREGNYLAALSSDFSGGVGNNILYLSSNKDLLRGYLKRLNGQMLPTLTGGAAYRSVMASTGDGFFKVMSNFSAVAQVLSRSGDLTPRQAAALRTVNLVGGVSSIVSDGVETRSVSLLNPNGGDAALLKLLTYAPDSFELLSEIPATAPSASVIGIDTLGWLEYAQSWFGEAGLSANERREGMEIIAKLGTRLGNEWGVVTTNTTDSSALVSSLGLGVGGTNLTSALGLLGNQGASTAFYAKTQDGALVLNDLETALTGFLSDSDGETSDATAPTLERTEVGGYEALMLTSTSRDPQGVEIQQNFLIVNKNDTIVIGFDINALDGYLTAAPLLDNEYFGALNIPDSVTGVQFIAPLRLTRQEINTSITQILKAFDASNDVPMALRTAYGDWYESYASRTLPSYAYSSVDGNKLLSYGKSGFLWNK
mgnify:FL=1